MITVIIPIHKLCYMQNSIDNFNRQSFKEKELLFIFNGELLGYNNGNNNVYNSIDVDTCNIATIRNCGLNWMGENKRSIFSFFDSDDLYGSEYLTEAYNKLTQGYDIVGKLDYRFTYENDMYLVTGLVQQNQIHGPTMTGYLSSLRFDEFYESLAEDYDFISRHNKIGFTSVDNWTYIVRENSIQKRTFNSFFESIKIYATLTNNSNLKIFKNDNLIWKFGDEYNLKFAFDRPA